MRSFSKAVALAKIRSQQSENKSRQVPSAKRQAPSGKWQVAGGRLTKAGESEAEKEEPGAGAEAKAGAGAGAGPSPRTTSEETRWRAPARKRLGNEISEKGNRFRIENFSTPINLLSYFFLARDILFFRRGRNVLPVGLGPISWTRLRSAGKCCCAITESSRACDAMPGRVLRQRQRRPVLAYFVADAKQLCWSKVQSLGC